jgi:hypothetical protein
MNKITITEALAEIKTIGKRLTSKKEFVLNYLVRADQIKDPLKNDGGSETAIKQELQSISDLETRIVDLRRGIQLANEHTKITIEGVERSISDWLVWRREVAPVRQQMLHALNYSLKTMRETGRKTTYNIKEEKPIDVVVNLDEQWLAKERELIEKILGQLDGILSLKNATVTIH